MSLSLAEWSTEELLQELTMTEQALEGYYEDYGSQCSEVEGYKRMAEYNQRLKRELVRREADTRPVVTE